jgi:hypothetical protein
MGRFPAAFLFAALYGAASFLVGVFAAVEELFSLSGTLPLLMPEFAKLEAINAKIFFPSGIGIKRVSVGVISIIPAGMTDTWAPPPPPASSAIRRYTAGVLPPAPKSYLTQATGITIRSPTETGSAKASLPLANALTCSPIVLNISGTVIVFSPVRMKCYCFAASVKCRSEISRGSAHLCT